MNVHTLISVDVCGSVTGVWMSLALRSRDSPINRRAPVSTWFPSLLAPVYIDDRSLLSSCVNYRVKSYSQLSQINLEMPPKRKAEDTLASVRPAPMKFQQYNPRKAIKAYEVKEATNMAAPPQVPSAVATSASVAPVVNSPATGRKQAVVVTSAITSIAAASASTANASNKEGGKRTNATDVNGAEGALHPITNESGAISKRSVKGKVKAVDIPPLISTAEGGQANATIKRQRQTASTKPPTEKKSRGTKGQWKGKGKAVDAIPQSMSMAGGANSTAATPSRPPTRPQLGTFIQTSIPFLIQFHGMVIVPEPDLRNRSMALLKGALVPNPMGDGSYFLGIQDGLYTLVIKSEHRGNQLYIWGFTGMRSDIIQVWMHCWNRRRHPIPASAVQDAAPAVHNTVQAFDSHHNFLHQPQVEPDVCDGGLNHGLQVQSSETELQGEPFVALPVGGNSNEEWNMTNASYTDHYYTYHHGTFETPQQGVACNYSNSQAWTADDGVYTTDNPSQYIYGAQVHWQAPAGAPVLEWPNDGPVDPPALVDHELHTVVESWVAQPTNVLGNTSTSDGIAYDTPVAHYVDGFPGTGYT
ncbi:hypothetical protein BDQ12DRAFT_270032 [Crucibulum laeve]|uniref:Uncharacterized protein n=1 Tax=Crucibulum laeve TaxID=68775 RepID=A0A5C3MAQ2_9AGAR|nr:hypothetical protein BDQ12DRAFT_270032 [Crucibulum laeve]